MEATRIKKSRNQVDEKSLYKKKRKGFHGIRHPTKEPSNDIAEIPSSSSVVNDTNTTILSASVVASLR